jgi:hypothetical protein
MNNKELIKLNISEAIEQLQDIISKMESDPEYSEPELMVELGHAYHHINYAWHIRNGSEKEAEECSEEHYIKWSKFPVGEILEYE